MSTVARRRRAARRWYWACGIACAVYLALYAVDFPLGASVAVLALYAYHHGVSNSAWADGYTTGREAAAQAIERAVIAGADMPRWAAAGKTPTAGTIRGWAALLARGEMEN